jgi:hypothetical protein
MANSPTLIALMLVAGVLLGLLAAPYPGSVHHPPTQESDGSAQTAPAAPPPAKVDPQHPNAVLVKHVTVFDGKTDTLTVNTSVLISGNKIDKIGGDMMDQSYGKTVNHAGTLRFPQGEESIGLLEEPLWTWPMLGSDLVASTEVK